MVRALKAIDLATLALLVIDASDGVTRQDQRLAERVDAAGNPIVVVLNKWDLLDNEAKEKVRAQVADMLGFVSYAPAMEISAKTDAVPIACTPPSSTRSRLTAKGCPRRRSTVPWRPLRRPNPRPRCPRPVRHARSDRPAHVHALHVQANPAELPALSRAVHPRALRLRPHAARTAGPAPRQLSAPGLQTLRIAMMATSSARGDEKSRAASSRVLQTMLVSWPGSRRMMWATLSSPKSWPPERASVRPSV